MCIRDSAFPGQNRGEVSITLFRSGKNYLLEVADNGVGIPDDVDIKKTDSLGLLIVHTLTLPVSYTHLDVYKRQLINKPP